MLEILNQFIASTLEYQNWGLNALTISFFLSLFVSGVSAWGLLQQNKSMWRRQAAETVSIIWLSYYGVLQLVILTYGIFIHSAALMVNGLLALLYALVLVGLWKFKGFKRTDAVAAALFLAALAAMVVTPYKPWFFLVFAGGGLLAALTQPMEMWRKKSAQGLNERLVGALLFGNVVWLVYGVAVSDWVLITINAIAFTIFGTTLYLARLFRRGLE